MSLIQKVEPSPSNVPNRMKLTYSYAYRFSFAQTGAFFFLHQVAHCPYYVGIVFQR